MAGLVLARPAEAGRVVLALVISALLHAAALLPPGAPPADANIRPGPLQPPSGGLPLRLTLRATPANGIDPEIPDVVETAEKPSAVAPLEATGSPQTVTMHDPLLSFAAAERYYPVNELDVRPQIRTRINPEYPRSASEQGLTANLVIRVYIDEAGRVQNVVVPGAEPANLFADAVAAAFRKARYTPGIKDGKPVKSLVFIEVNFETVDETATFRGGRY